MWVLDGESCRLKEEEKERKRAEKVKRVDLFDVGKLAWLETSYP